ncbi:MAG: outer membrane protein assembly factor BamA [Clostridiales bacterium]|nr:outer membrane protein assembly factor BamA [Clostridiales bacterium]
MKKLVKVLFFICVPVFLAAQEQVEKIEIIGNERVSRETILYYLQSREGGYFSDELLQKDFRILWSTGFFSNLRIEKEDGAAGKIVKIIVEENPVIRTITYKTGKKVKEDDIVNKLKEKDKYILPYSYYSAAKVQKVKETITDLLLEKGLYAAKVEVEASRKGKNEVEVLFKVDEGPKIRVGEVAFAGSPKLPQGILREAMKSNQSHGVVSWVLGKDVYKENKLTEDLTLIKQKLQEYGYMEATVGEPKIEQITRKTIFFKKQPMMKIHIPVNAGYLYLVGDVTIEGSKAIAPQYLRSLIKLKKGDIYSTKVREKSVESIGELYRNGGYLYVQVMPVESLDPKNKRVNVAFNIYEGEVAYLHRLEFRGNTYTKDKVIRREMLLREGDRFSLALFKDSILRIKQLGLVDLEKEPDVKPNPEDPTKIDASINVKELQRNNIQFSAGYSGYEGMFVALSYSTVNFLGAGENLEITAQYGKRIKNYVFGFSEPYFLDYPITLGFNIYDRFFILPYLYDRKGRGADLIVGARLRGYVRGNLTYSYENVEISPSSYQDDEYLGYYSPYSYSYGYPYYGGYGYGKYAVSALIPTVYRSTVDSPLTPTRGRMVLVSMKYAGGFLGGEVNFVKPHVELTSWFPITRNQSFGLHFDYSFIRAFGGSDIPFWERFYMGGERDIRGYDIYSIGPRTEQGSLIGGEKSVLFNAEYVLQVGGPLYLILFYDRGNCYIKSQPISFRNMYSSAGLEARIFVPALRVPFRLIFAYNNRRIYEGDSNFNFRFAIGTTF